MFTLKLVQWGRVVASGNAETEEVATALESALETQAGDELEVGYFDCVLSEEGVGIIDAWISVH